MSKNDYETRLNRLIFDWIESGRTEQEGFDWSKSRQRWNHEFPKYKNHISELPDQLDRKFVRKVFETDIDVISKFLTSMIWGYGDRGYGSYRVSKMLEQRDCRQILGQVLEFGSNGKPLEAYKFLEQNRIRNLGPSFSTKFIYFSTPREVGAPILDSYIAKWIKHQEIDTFSNLSMTTERWNFKAYSEYWRWTRDISLQFDILADELELIIFRDAEELFSKNSSWGGK